MVRLDTVTSGDKVGYCGILAICFLGITLVKLSVLSFWGTGDGLSFSISMASVSK